MLITREKGQRQLLVADRKFRVRFRRVINLKISLENAFVFFLLLNPNKNLDLVSGAHLELSLQRVRWSNWNWFFQKSSISTSTARQWTGGDWRARMCVLLSLYLFSRPPLAVFASRWRTFLSRLGSLTFSLFPLRFIRSRAHSLVRTLSGVFSSSSSSSFVRWFFFLFTSSSS